MLWVTGSLDIYGWMLHLDCSYKIAYDFFHLLHLNKQNTNLTKPQNS